MNSLAWKHFASAVGCAIKTVEVPCALGSAHLQFVWLLLLMMASVGQSGMLWSCTNATKDSSITTSLQLLDFALIDVGIPVVPLGVATDTGEA